MLQLKELGTFEAVPEIVIDIVKGNIKALENALIDGWDIHKPIQLDNYSEYSPLELALVINCLPSVQWLVEHGVDLSVLVIKIFLGVVGFGGLLGLGPIYML